MHEKLKVLNQQGYARIKVKDEIFRLDNANEMPLDIQDIFLVVDRIITKNDEDFHNRLADATQTAFFEGKGECFIESLNDNKQKYFSNKFDLDGISFLEPNVHLFSFNNPYGACKKCEGFGSIIGIDEGLVIPDKSLSVFDNSVPPGVVPTLSTYPKLVA